MDEQDLPKSASGSAAPVDPDQKAWLGADSTLVFFGNPARVSEGFSIALRVMGIDASMDDVVIGDRPQGSQDSDAR